MLQLRRRVAAPRSESAKWDDEMANIMSPFSLDEMLTNAVVMHWKEFGATSDALLHVEYHRLPSHRGVDYFRVWSSTTHGEWDLVCQYGLSEDQEGRLGTVTFHPPFYSANLGQMFMAIMQNEGCFEDRAEKTRDGMIQISAPTAAEGSAAQAALQKAFADCNIASPESGAGE